MTAEMPFQMCYRRKLKMVLMYLNLMIELHNMWTTDVNMRNWKYIEIACKRYGLHPAVVHILY